MQQEARIAKKKAGPNELHDSFAGATSAPHEEEFLFDRVSAYPLFIKIYYITVRLLKMSHEELEDVIVAVNAGF